MRNTTANSRLIRAAPDKIYQAFADAHALETWLAPGDMTGKVHSLDFRVGGGYEMSLFYPPAAGATGEDPSAATDPPVPAPPDPASDPTSNPSSDPASDPTSDPASDPTTPVLTDRPEKENRGKTTANEDRFTARFVELVPNKKIVEAVHFHSSDAAFSGAMIMEVRLEPAEEGTKVSFLFRNIPAGIRPEDNEKGTEQTLEKLARYVE